MVLCVFVIIEHVSQIDVHDAGFHTYQLYQLVRQEEARYMSTALIKK